MSDWQPIATAPKDGTEVLVYWPYWHNTPIVARVDKFGRWTGEMAVSTDDGDGPTHWMPLPDPPTWP